MKSKKVQMQSFNDDEKDETPITCSYPSSQCPSVSVCKSGQGPLVRRLVECAVAIRPLCVPITLGVMWDWEHPPPHFTESQPENTHQARKIKYTNDTKVGCVRVFFVHLSMTHLFKYLP